jgi:hypothetical protein
VIGAQSLVTLLLAGCTPPYWVPGPITLPERQVLGCYSVRIGPWNNSTEGITQFQMRLDSLQSQKGTHDLLPLGSPRRIEERAEWTVVSSDSLVLTLYRGVEGQRLQFQLRVHGDSLRGAAFEHNWQAPDRTAPINASRIDCPR